MGKAALGNEQMYYNINVKRKMAEREGNGARANSDKNYEWRMMGAQREAGAERMVGMGK